MSLIQDALKRKTEEQPSRPQPAAQTPPPAEASPPVQPAGAKPPAPPQQNAASGKLFMLSTVVLMLLLLAIGFNRFRTPDQPAPVRQAAKPAPAQAAEEPRPRAAPAAKQPAIPAPAVAEKTPAPEPAVENETAAPEPAVAAAAWPELTFSGSAALGTRRMAVINGRMLAAGESIKGVKVIRVQKTTAVLEYRGEQRTLSVDDQ